MSNKKSDASKTDAEVFGGRLPLFIGLAVVLAGFAFWFSTSMGKTSKQKESAASTNKSQKLSANYGISAEEGAKQKSIASPEIIKARYQIIERRSIENKIRIEKEMQERKEALEIELRERNAYMAPIREAQAKDPVAEVDVVLKPINSPGAPDLIWSIDDAEIDNRK